MNHLRFTSDEGGDAFGIEEFRASNADEDPETIARWVEELAALPIGGTWSFGFGPTFTRVDDAPTFTAEGLLSIVAAARARVVTPADLALVDDADACLVFDRTGAREETRRAIVALEEIAKRPARAVLAREVQGKTGRYTLRRTSAAARWSTCSCPSFLRRRAGVVDCKHLRAANGAGVVVDDRRAA